MSNGTTSEVILVACSGPKQHHPCRARDLYRSKTFQLAKQYAILSGRPWRILSAKHGLLHPDTQIQPYDLRPIHLGVAGRREWVSLILRQLDQDRVFDGKTIEVLAGADYCRTLVPALQQRGFEVVLPLAGLGHGQRQKWLTLQLLRGASSGFWSIESDQIDRRLAALVDRAMTLNAARSRRGDPGGSGDDEA